MRLEALKEKTKSLFLHLETFFFTSQLEPNHRERGHKNIVLTEKSNTCEWMSRRRCAERYHEKEGRRVWNAERTGGDCVGGPFRRTEWVHSHRRPSGRAGFNDYLAAADFKDPPALLSGRLLF